MATSDPHVLGPDRAPTPFTADEIRQGCPVGRRTVVRTMVLDREPTFEEIVFVRHTLDGAVRTTTPIDTDGQPIGEPKESESTWGNLQAHASFPADATTVTPIDLELGGLGALECLLYTVERQGSVNRYWFATSKPGMPVQWISSRDGEVLTVSTVIADDTPMG